MQDSTVTMSKRLIPVLLCLLPFAASGNDQPVTQSPDLSAIMAQYFKAQGGLDYIESIDGLRMTGVAIMDDKEMDFVQVKKRPNMLRMTIEYGPTTLIMGYNGLYAWQTSRGREKALLMEGKQATDFIRNAAMFSQLYQPDDPNVTLDLLGEDVVDDKPVYVLEVTLSDGFKMRYFVDTKSYVDLKLEYKDEVDGVTHVMSNRFKDYRKIEQLMLPHHVDSYKDGELISTVKLDNIDLNPGIFSPYFDPPGGIEGVDEPVTARELAEQEARDTGEITEESMAKTEQKPVKAIGTITSTTSLTTDRTVKPKQEKSGE